MKKLILILSLFASTVQAQQETISIQDMQYNLFRSHQEYRTGTVMIVGGLLAVAASVAAKDADLPSKEIGYFGAAFLTIGCVIHIDSHKWIGRAGKNIKL
jgi:hypothetical protein